MEIVTLFIISLIFIFIGITNMRGNISTVHWYHRQRIKKSDIKKYGMIVGSSMILLGLSMLATALVDLIWQIDISLIMTVSLFISICLIIYAQYKYNKGIF